MIGYTSFLIFFISFLVKTIIRNSGKEDSISFYILLIPALFGILNFTISLNFFLYMKYLIEMNEYRILNNNENNNEINNNNNNNCTKGKFFSYFFLNFVAVLLLIFLILLSIKLENNSNAKIFSVNMVNMPIYFSLGIAFCYLIYMLPALIQHKFYWGISLMISYLINFFIFFLLATLKFDYMKNITNLEWFIPLYIAVFLNIIYSIYDLIKGNTNIVFRIFFCFSMILILIATLFTSIVLDDKEYSRMFECILLFLIAYVILIIEKIYILIFEGGEDNDNDNDMEKDN